MAIVTTSVQKIGFGTWQMGGETQFGNRQTGWGRVDETEALNTVHFALDNGIRFFDTADAYGKGNSESFLGKAFKQKPVPGIKICTKIGSRWDEAGNFFQDFSVNWLEQAFANCLKRLQVAHVDTLLLHSPPVDFDWTSFDFSFFDKLKEKGVINRYGVSVKSLKAIPSVQQNNVGSVIEAIFNVLDRRLLAVSAQNTGFFYIARVPLSSGFLTEKTFSQFPSFSSTDIRQYIPPADVQWLVENVRKLDFLRALPGGIETSALRFCISFDAIGMVIPGMYKTKHVQSALLANELGPLPVEALNKIEEVITDLPPGWK